MRKKTWLALFTFFIFLFAAPLAAYSQQATTYVNAFIGTSNEGNTHPGAVMPFGLASVAPHTRLKGPTCYVYGEPHIYGFGHLQMSGVGCPDAGSIVVKPVNGPLQFDVEKTKSTYSDEKAAPGFYAVYLNDHHTVAQMTATLRSGRSRYVFPAGEHHLLLDVSQSLSHSKQGYIKKISALEFEGYAIDGQFCGNPIKRQVYFYAKISGPVIAAGLYQQGIQTTSAEAEGTETGGWVSFRSSATDTVEVQVGISLVSTANAKENLLAEQQQYSFEELQQQASGAWEKELATIKIEGGTKEDKIRFYTALYHSLLTPAVYNDHNGDYLTMQSDTAQKRFVRKSPFTRYTVYSLWDTYRTLHPLLTLTHPKRQRDMVQSMVDMYKEGGWLPKWEIYGQESYVMVGDPAVPVITDTYLKGIRDFDIQTAYKAMLKGATTLFKNNLRPGINDYWKHGYIPIDKRGGTDSTRFDWTNGYVWGTVSSSLEYYLADYNISRIAGAMGDNRNSQKFLQQSKQYQKLYDKQTGFFRPRLSNGSWLHPFDPLDRTFDIRWEKSGGYGYVEGTAWNYRFFVPHDTEGMIRLYGEKPFLLALQKHFDSSYFDMSNEPDISYPFLFNYSKGSEWQTQEKVKHCIETYFTVSPKGLPGNDDAGTMSAWLVFAMMGIFPDSPGKPHYQLTTPAFEKITLQLDQKYYKGNKLVIESRGKGDYIQSIWLDGKKYNGFQISHQDLIKSKQLVFVRSRTPVKNPSTL